MNLYFSEESRTEQTLNYKLFLQREYSIYHLPYEKEMEFYTAVKKGDIDQIKEKMLPLRSELLGRLSSNNMRNLKYHLVITIAMITRFCIEGGMPPETAYTLSDIYIQKVDGCDSEEEINRIHRNITFDFAHKMQALNKKHILSKAVVKTMDYIYDHLHEKIYLEDCAAQTGLNKTYLCSLFKSETGITINSFITRKKIEAAEKMLVSTSFSVWEISNYLAFSSHSYFISVFRKQTGKTPREYRSKKFRSFIKTEASP